MRASTTGCRCPTAPSAIDCLPPRRSISGKPTTYNIDRWTSAQLQPPKSRSRPQIDHVLAVQVSSAQAGWLPFCSMNSPHTPIFIVTGYILFSFILILFSAVIIGSVYNIIYNKHTNICFFLFAWLFAIRWCVLTIYNPLSHLNTLTHNTHDLQYTHFDSCKIRSEHSSCRQIRTSLTHHTDTFLELFTIYSIMLYIFEMYSINIHTNHIHHISIYKQNQPLNLSEIKQLILFLQPESGNKNPQNSSPTSPPPPHFDIYTKRL